MAKRKFYVVWEGRQPGIYDDWDEAQAQVEGFPGARFKSFTDQQAATEAFRGDGRSEQELIASIAQMNAARAERNSQGGRPRYLDIPEIDPAAWAVDGATSRNPGPMEYRGVRLSDGVEMFHMGPLADGTNNIAEYLAIVHALALLYNANDSTTPIYSDSLTARAWVRRRGHNSSIAPTPENLPVRQLLGRADRWLQTHTPRNRLLQWDTDAWGEIPADFGRK